MAGALMALQRRRSARNAGDWKGMATAWSWCLDPASDVRVCALNDVAGWWEDAVDVGLVAQCGSPAPILSRAAP